MKLRLPLLLRKVLAGAERKERQSGALTLKEFHEENLRLAAEIAKRMAVIREQQRQ